MQQDEQAALIIVHQCCFEGKFGLYLVSSPIFRAKNEKFTQYELATILRCLFKLNTETLVFTMFPHLSFVRSREVTEEKYGEGRERAAGVTIVQYSTVQNSTLQYST